MYSEEQFNEIYQSCKRDVLKVAFGMLNDRDLALDISQDVFFKLYKCLDNNVEIPHPKSWLRTVTRNGCIDYLRRNCKFKIVPLAEDIYLYNANNSVETKYEIEGMFSALCAKNQLWYDIVVLFFKGYTYREIGISYEMSESEVQRIIVKARMYLKGHFYDVFREILMLLISLLGYAGYALNVYAK